MAKKNVKTPEPPLTSKSFNHLIDALKLLAEKDEVKVSLKNSAITGSITGVSAVLTGVLLTPLGLTSVGAIAGASIGSAASTYFYRGKSKPLVKIIDEMSESEKKELFKHVIQAVREINIEDVETLIFILCSGKDHIVECFVRKVLSSHVDRINNR